ncbi:MAG TPA: hypothetical protein VEF04_10275, partial [Blastocatellia bacterium]|nr:hypothetical protein [Blastocatellia bacterium]
MIPEIAAHLEESEDLSEAQMDALIAQAAMRMMQQQETSAKTPSVEEAAQAEALHRVIRTLYMTGKVRLVGIGAGAIEVCRALGGECATESERVKLCVDAVAESHHEIASHVLGSTISDDAVTSLSRITLSKMTQLPVLSKTIATSKESNEILAFRTLNEASQTTVLCINGNFDVECEPLIDRWIPLLDDALLLASTDALKVIEICRQDTSASLGIFWSRLVATFVMDPNENRLVQQLRELSHENDRLKRENALLKAQLLELQTSQSKPSTAKEDGGDSTQEAIRIRSILAGAGSALLTKEESDQAENGLIDLTSQLSLSEPNEFIAASTPILSFVLTNESPHEIVFGGTDKNLYTLVGK